jgi:hypothetical protein
MQCYGAVVRVAQRSEHLLTAPPIGRKHALPGFVATSTRTVVGGTIIAAPSVPSERAPASSHRPRLGCALSPCRYCWLTGAAALGVTSMTTGAKSVSAEGRSPSTKAIASAWDFLRQPNSCCGLMSCSRAIGDVDTRDKRFRHDRDLVLVRQSRRRWPGDHLDASRPSSRSVISRCRRATMTDHIEPQKVGRHSAYDAPSS